MPNPLHVPGAYFRKPASADIEEGTEDGHTPPEPPEPERQPQPAGEDAWIPSLPGPDFKPLTGYREKPVAKDVGAVEAHPAPEPPDVESPFCDERGTTTPDDSEAMSPTAVVHQSTSLHSLHSFQSLTEFASTSKAARAIGGFLQAFLLSICFIWTITLHESLPSVSQLEQAILFELREKPFNVQGKTVEDVHDVELFWKWVENGLLPTLINQHDPLGHLLPKSDWGYLGEYNKIVGGIRLIQHRSKDVDCKHVLAPQLHKHCYPMDTVSLRTFGLPACESSAHHGHGECYNESRYLGVVDVDHNEGFELDETYGDFELWLDTEEPEALLMQRLQYLEDRHWVDKQTKTLEVDLLFVNTQYEPLICLARLIFTLKRSGYFDVNVHIETVPVAPYAKDMWLKYTLEALYLMFLAFIVHRRGQDLVRHIRSHGVSKLWPPTRMSLSQSIDFVNLLVGIVLVGCWIDFLGKCNHFVSLLNALEHPDGSVGHGSDSYDTWNEYHHDVAALEEAAHHMLIDLTLARDVACVTLLTLIVRFFKSWEEIPAMAVISRTCQVAAGHLVSLLIAVFVLVLMWAGAGMVLFGHQISSYTEIWGAIGKTFQIVLVADDSLLGDMNSIAPGFAVVWHWSLLVMMYVVVLNIVLAVLVRSFEEAAAALQQHQHASVFAQAKLAAKHSYQEATHMLSKMSSTTSTKDAP
eukprot:TRINITY_DN35700_c0_g2_i1.p1 TRINITY_DN35700_c0_g2~~TRINITY_DN35700_c0_g2_i1.p1  ORF type:complete len:695 (+),score=108.04 TRINITY_DN35700_c0_g2_i1:106-2190(+)